VLTLVLVAGLMVASIFVPPLQVHRISVRGASYVSEEAVVEALSGHQDTSMVLLPTGRAEAQAESVPGVKSATVQRDWPDGITVEVTEREPLAELTGPDGTEQILDADGVVLPAESAKGSDTDLVPLTIAEDVTEPEPVGDAMLEVLASLPEDLRGQVTEIKASTPSDVALVIDVEGTAKTVVWGDASDGELKAEVTAALLDQPGTEIDVSSPVAPVTR
jgi:cell division protein FtsQ